MRISRHFAVYVYLALILAMRIALPAGLGAQKDDKPNAEDGYEPDAVAAEYALDSAEAGDRIAEMVRQELGLEEDDGCDGVDLPRGSVVDWVKMPLSLQRVTESFSSYNQDPIRYSWVMNEGEKFVVGSDAGAKNFDCLYQCAKIAREAGDNEQQDEIHRKIADGELKLHSCCTEAASENLLGSDPQYDLLMWIYDEFDPDGEEKINPVDFFAEAVDITEGNVSAAFHVSHNVMKLFGRLMGTNYKRSRGISANDSPSDFTPFTRRFERICDVGNTSCWYHFFGAAAFADVFGAFMAKGASIVDELLNEMCENSNSEQRVDSGLAGANFYKSMCPSLFPVEIDDVWSYFPCPPLEE
ncbi:hypothetical protein ACFL6Y_01400 [Elusimicrobiota bacterium]